MNKRIVDDDDDLFFRQKELISNVVYYIEIGNLKAIKQAVPSLVKPDSRSGNLGYKIIDIAKYLKKNDIVEYLEQVQKQEDDKRVAVMGVCIKNIEDMRKAIIEDNWSRVLSLLGNPKELFCSDDKKSNLELLLDFERGARSEMMKSVFSMHKAGLLKRYSNLFQ